MIYIILILVLYGKYTNGVYHNLSSIVNSLKVKIVIKNKLINGLPWEKMWGVNRMTPVKWERMKQNYKEKLTLIKCTVVCKEHV